MATSKFCFTCKHVQRKYRQGWFSPILEPLDEYAKCDHPNFVDPVTGKGDNFCQILRFTGIHNCGPEGRFWEPKKEDGQPCSL